MASKAVHRSYAYTKAGELGKKRDTMLLSELQMQPRIGKCKQRGYYFPDEWIFGIPYPKDQGCVAEAMRGWDLPTQEERIVKSTTVPDFLTMNINAIRDGLHTAPEYYNHRVKNNIIKDIQLDFKPRDLQMKFPPGKIFGRPYRPSTPMFDIIEHAYQKKWIKNRKDELEKENRKRAQLKQRIDSVYRTKATMVRNFQLPVKAPPIWHLPRFTKSAQPHLETFRSKNQHDKAFETFHYDEIARRGTLGQGAYEFSKN